MFDRIFGEYLLQKNIIKKEQLEKVYQGEENKRVRLGVIAVTEQLLTVNQVDEINKLQAIMDMRFGDIAVEKGYLSEGQVRRLLQLQGNLFLIFIESILEAQVATLEEITEYLVDYQKENDFTQTDMDNLKSGDFNRVISVFIGYENEILKQTVNVMLRTVFRLIDYHIYIKAPYKVTSYEANTLGIQLQKGDHDILTCIAGDGESILKIAQQYAGEKFVTDKEDAVDAIGELLNCINGLVASDLSFRSIEIDMLSPEYYNGQRVIITGDSLLVLPIYLCGHTVDYIISIDSNFKIES